MFAIKVDPLNLEFKKKVKNIPVDLPSYPIKIWGKSVKGFLSYDLTNKQTNRDYNFIHRDIRQIDIKPDLLVNVQLMTTANLTLSHKNRAINSFEL